MLSTNYHTWCIHEEGIIQSNENNFVLVYLGTVRCGALPGTCGWQAQILAFSKDRFTSQQNWEIKVENTGFTSLKETLTTRNGLTDRQGWLIVSGEEVSLKITDENEVKGQWIVSTAPSC